MFDQTFVDVNTEIRKPWTIGASVVLQLGVTAVLLLIPLLHPEMLKLHMEIPVWVPLQPLTRQPPPQAASAAPARASASHSLLPTLVVPTKVPRTTSFESDDPPITSFMMTGPVSSSGTSTIPGIPDALPAYVAPAPPQPVLKKPEPPKGPTHVSSGVQSARLIFGPKPAYPATARAARVQGTVRIQAIIAADGTIRNLNVINGPVLLIKAALEAVQQWRYQPTLLNGQPVEVATEIDVNFRLSQ